MPTYEYQCDEGHEFECFQKISDKALKRCEVCGAPAHRRISGGQGLIFKGSGFYITDYGKDGKGPRKDGGGEGGGTAGSDSAASADKPAAKAKAADASSPAVPSKPAAKIEKAK